MFIFFGNTILRAQFYFRVKFECQMLREFAVMILLLLTTYSQISQIKQKQNVFETFADRFKIIFRFLYSYLSIFEIS